MTSSHYVENLFGQISQAIADYPGIQSPGWEIEGFLCLSEIKGSANGWDNVQHRAVVINHQVLAVQHLHVLEDVDRRTEFFLLEPHVNYPSSVVASAVLVNETLNSVVLRVDNGQTHYELRHNLFPITDQEGPWWNWLESVLRKKWERSEQVRQHFAEYMSKATRNVLIPLKQFFQGYGDVFPNAAFANRLLYFILPNMGQCSDDASVLKMDNFFRGMSCGLPGEELFETKGAYKVFIGNRIFALSTKDNPLSFRFFVVNQPIDLLRKKTLIYELGYNDRGNRSIMANSETTNQNAQQTRHELVDVTVRQGPWWDFILNKLQMAHDIVRFHASQRVHDCTAYENSKAFKQKMSGFAAAYQNFMMKV